MISAGNLPAYVKNKQEKKHPMITTRKMPIGRRFTIKNLNGKSFGRLEVLGLAGQRPSNRQTLWLCRCACGKFKVIGGSELQTGNTSSCGCLKRESERLRGVTHGESAGGRLTPEYRSYLKAKERCSDPDNPKHRHYAGRGIEFRFSSFEQFLAEVGRKPTPKHSIDRKDNNGHYEPGNIKWSTPKEQSLNRRPSSEWRKSR